MRYHQLHFLLLLACLSVLRATVSAGDQARAEAEAVAEAEIASSPETWLPSIDPPSNEGDGTTEDERASLPFLLPHFTQEPAVVDDVFVPLRAWKEQKIQDIQLHVQRKREEETRANLLAVEADAEQRMGENDTPSLDELRCRVLRLLSRPFCERNDTLGSLSETLEPSVSREKSSEAPVPSGTRLNSRDRSRVDLHGVEGRPTREAIGLPTVRPSAVRIVGIDEKAGDIATVAAANAVVSVPSVWPSVSSSGNLDSSTVPTRSDFRPGEETTPIVQLPFPSLTTHHTSIDSSEEMEIPTAPASARSDSYARPGDDEAVAEHVEQARQAAGAREIAKSPSTHGPSATGRGFVHVGHAVLRSFREYFETLASETKNFEVFILSCLRVLSLLPRVGRFVTQTKVPIVEVASDKKSHDRKVSTANMTQDSASPTPTYEVAVDPGQWHLKVSHDKPFNFASNDAGARVLAASANAVGSKNVLNSNPDMYMLVPCEGDGVGGSRWIDVELSEDAVLTSFETANFEFYSSFPRRVAILGATSYPPKLWNTVAVFDMASVRLMQKFAIPGRTVARYLRIVYVGKQGSEFYCPVSVIRVFGKTLLADWKDELDGAPEASSSPAPSPEGTTHTKLQKKEDADGHEGRNFRISRAVSEIGSAHARGSQSDAARTSAVVPVGDDESGSRCQ
jgi:hypothetical protein